MDANTNGPVGPGTPPLAGSAATAVAAASTDDYVAVQRLVHRYADAVIHRDGARWGSCWADDAVWDLGRGRLVEGREAILQLWYGAMTGMAAVFQVVQNGDVWTTDDPDRAVGRWYITERFHRADGNAGTLLAHYDDEYVRVDGEWRFARRFLQPHYMGAPDLSGTFLNTRDALHERGVGSADA